MVYQSPSLDRTFGALADPTRRAILQRLARGEETIGHLAGRFTMSLPAVSKHVRVLERAGLVKVQQQGRTRHTTLSVAPMKGAVAWIEQYRRFWEHQFDRLAEYLESTSENPATEDAPWPAPAPPSPPSKSGARSTRRAPKSSPRGRGRKNSRNGVRRGR
jgi:DNA-binding transcriptional ArsR family regulator